MATTFTKALTDAEDFAELVNGDGLVTTRYGYNPKKSWLYMEGEFNDFLENAQGRGVYYVVGSFESGFTYTDINQTGTYNNGGTLEYYVFTGGLDSLPHAVTAGTNPNNNSNYVRINYNSSNQVINNDGSTVQEKLFNLKASDVTLAVKDNLPSDSVTLQETSDWYGVYVSQFIREDDETISDGFNRTLDYCRNLPYKGTKIIFPRGETWKYDDNHIIGNLSHCVIDLNGSTMQRRSASTFSSPTTEIIPAGVGYNAKEIHVEDASKFKVGDKVFAIKSNRLSGTSSDAREIVNITGNILTIAAAFFFGGGGTGYDSNSPIGTIICKSVNFIGGGATSVDGKSNDKFVVCNGEVDGNASSQPSNAWVFNTEIVLISNKGSIHDITFRNTAGECIVGHGLDVHDNQFFDLSGSCFHTSVHDNSLGTTGGSWFRHNQCERTNLATQAVSGHAEGLITFSWGAGRLVVSDNICKDGTESFLGTFGSPTEDNPDKYLVVHNNIVERFPTFMNYLAVDALGVSLTENILIETGVAPQVQQAIYLNPSIKCSGNISVGSNGTPTLENVSRDERLAIGNDVQIQERQRAVISDPGAHEGLNLAYVHNPVNAQFVVQGLNTVTECAVRVNGDYVRSLYTPNGVSAGTFTEYWVNANQQMGYLINPASGSGGSFYWATYNGGIQKHLSIDDEGVSFDGMQEGRATYYGEKNTDGSWRVMILAGDLVHQKLVGGTWVTKQTISG